MTAIGEIIVSGVLFIVLWVVLGQGVFKHFFAMLTEREERTAGAREKAGRLQEEAATVQSEIDRSLSETRVEAVRLRDDFVLKAKAEAQGILDKASEEGQKRLEAARADITQSREAALETVHSEAQQLGRALVEKALSSGSPVSIH